MSRIAQRPKKRHGGGSLANRRVRLLVAAIAVLGLAFAAAFLSGCKYSDVLTDYFENAELGTLDENVDPTYQANPESDIILDLAELTIDDSDVIDTQTQVLPHYDPSAPDNGPTPRRLKRTETPHDEKATEATENSEAGDREGEGAEGDAGGSGGTEDDGGNDDPGDPDDPDNSDDSDDSKDPEELEDPENPTNPDDPENTDGDPENNDETDEKTDDDDDSGPGDDNEITDPDDGTTEETAKGTVAAVGEYATIAQMLGGAGALVACDEEWLAARQKDGCFSGELDKVKVAFSGDGTAEGNCDVDLLINTVKPSVILYDGHAPALTDADREKLEAANITIQPVPTIGKQTTEDYAVTQAVLQVGEILKAVAPGAPAMASEYVAYHDTALRKAYEANGNAYSYKRYDTEYMSLYQDTPLAGLDNSTKKAVSCAYIDDWLGLSISQATVNQRSALSTDNIIITLASDRKTLTVPKGIGVSASNESGGYFLLDYYLQLAGIVDNAFDTDKLSATGLPVPVMVGDSTDIEQELKGRTTTRMLASALFYNAGPSTESTNWVAVGGSDGENHTQADFPGVLVKDAAIMKKVKDSADQKNGLYHTSNSYRVAVVPSGIAGSWSEGHIDSFFMALWALNLRDESKLSELATSTGTFYDHYFRCKDWKNDDDTDGKAVKNWNNSVNTQGD